MVNRNLQQRVQIKKKKVHLFVHFIQHFKDLTAPESLVINKTWRWIFPAVERFVFSESWPWLWRQHGAVVKEVTWSQLHRLCHSPAAGHRPSLSLSLCPLQIKDKYHPNSTSWVLWVSQWIIGFKRFWRIQSTLLKWSIITNHYYGCHKQSHSRQKLLWLRDSERIHWE